MKNLVRGLLATVSVVISVSDGTAWAQSGAPASTPAQGIAAGATADDGIGEITVTARKREETLISVPVAVTAISSATIANRALNGIDAIATLVPGLLVGEGGGSQQGGPISMRGIGASEANTLSEQAVSFNFDGVQVARSSPRRLGNFDIAQVEVLKGPQSLFYGKNSPGGIITYRTNDPGDHFEAGGNIGYEFKAHEVRGDGYISGPLAEGLGARLAFYGSDMRGWIRNTNRDLPQSLGSKYAPDAREYAVRGTLKFDDGGRFRARAKLSYNNYKDKTGPTGTVQFVDCPRGQPQNGFPDDCKANGRYSTVGQGTGFNVINPYVGDSGDFRMLNKQWLGGLELNYDISDPLTLTAITGYYNYKFNGVASYTQSGNPAFALIGVSDSGHEVFLRELGQELRLASAYDGPVNFTAGATYQETEGQGASVAYIGSNLGGTSGLGVPAGTRIVDFLLRQKGSSYSGFLQLQVKPIDTIEISGGARYTHEEKRIVEARNLPNTAINLVGITPNLSNGRQKREFNNVSPEATISYRPNSDLNIYTSYKAGYLSGGYNGGSFTPTNVTYDPQKVKGFEGGVKANLGSGLRADLALYTYKITGLQVQVTEVTAQVIKNAASVRTKGVELGLTYVPVRGLTLTANGAYADGRYLSYFASCNRGQVAPECLIRQDGTPTGSALQDLSGTRLLRDPKWAGNVGFNFDRPVSDALKLNVNGGMTFSSRYVSDASASLSQKSYQLFDLAVSVATLDQHWNVSLIGKNLTNEYYFVRSVTAPFTGSAPNVNTTTPGVPGDIVAAVSRGRQIMLRVGFQY